MKRLIFVNRFFYPDQSATAQILTELTLRLSEAPSLETIVVTSRQRYMRASASLPSYARIGDVQIRRVWSTRFGRARLAGRMLDYLSFYFSTLISLVCLTRRGDIVVAKTDPPLISVVACVACKLRGGVLVNWLQDVFPEIAVELNVRGVSFVAPVLTKLRNWSVRCARQNVVLGDRMLDRLRRQAPRAPFTVIQNWSDEADMLPVRVDENPLRKAWGLKDYFVVEYSGNMGRVHDFATLLGAAKVIDEYPAYEPLKIVFLFIGEGVKRAEIEQFSKQHRLRNIQFKPYQPRSDLAQTLSVADVHVITLKPGLEGLVVPSKYYGTAAVARPAIFVGDKDGEVPRLMRRSTSGVSVAEGDVQGLVSVITRLASDREYCSRLGRNARIAFEQEFSKSRAVDEWRSLLGRVIAGDADRVWPRAD